jgi:putative FmdB family regulatory protein
VPLYEYQCKQCQHRFEKIQSFSAPDEKACPQCGGELERLISAPAIQFKGAGWYVNDYAGRNKAPSSGGSDGGLKEGGSKEGGSKDGGGKEAAAAKSSESSSKSEGGRSEGGKSDGGSKSDSGAASSSSGNSAASPSNTGSNTKSST